MDQPDTLGAERFKIRSARNERNVLSGERKSNPHVAADGTDSNNRYLHAPPPPCRNKESQFALDRCARIRPAAKSGRIPRAAM
jgi:hypothetical protein